MRAIFILLMSVIFILTGCASVEIAKEVTKVTKSIETSIKKKIKPKEEKQKQVIVETKQKQVISEEEDQKQEILIEKKRITHDQQKISEVVSKQKKVASLNLLNKTFKELNQLIGQPQLFREDRQTITARYDSKSCRIFVFMNSTVEKRELAVVSVINT